MKELTPEQLTQTLDLLKGHIQALEFQRDNWKNQCGHWRSECEKVNDCLRRKDTAMGVLFKRLDDNHIDCSDLIP